MAQPTSELVTAHDPKDRKLLIKNNSRNNFPEQQKDK
jgi:hypothetical protein